MRCPECEQKIDDCDWFYTYNLYDPEGEDTKVKCPHCDKYFMARSWASIEVSCCTIEEYKKYGEIE